MNNLVNPDKNNIVIGSKYNDKHLEGDGGQNIIDGGKGHDIIVSEIKIKFTVVLEMMF